MDDQQSDELYHSLLEDDAEQLYEQAPCGYLSTTPDGTIIKANRTFLDLLGYQREDLVGRRTFAELLSPGGRIFHETHYAPSLRMQGTAREIAFDLVRKDGDRVPVLVNGVLESTADGRPQVVRTVVFDARERRQYERELLLATQRAEESEARAHALARTLQQTLIPPSAPDVPGLDVAAVYRPAGNGEEVGGDFYDIFQISDREWFVAIGDVCGKGVEAAVVTALARYTVRAAAVRFPDPGQSLEMLNEVLLHHETDRFCTVAAVRLRQQGGSWLATTATGGHPLPLLVREGASVTSVGEPGSLMGVVDDPVLRDTQVALRPGDTLVLFTDGVTEGRRGAQFFGEARLEAAVLRHAGSASAVAEGLLAELLEFQDDRPRDDIAVVVVRVPA